MSSTRNHKIHKMTQHHEQKYKDTHTGTHQSKHIYNFTFQHKENTNTYNMYCTGTPKKKTDCK